MADDIQLSILDIEEREGEFMSLSVEDEVLTPDSEMAPGELSAGDFADVRDRGLIVPIIVVPNPEGSAWAYEVKDGRRRLRAYRKLFSVGLKKFGNIPALVYTTYSEEDAETWASNVNSRRSPNPLTDLESIQAVMERYEVEVHSKEGLRFLSSKTGIPVSTLAKRLKLLDMPHAFLKAAAETAAGGKSKRKVPAAGLEVIAGLNKAGQDQLLGKLKADGAITWSDIGQAKENQTAAKVAELQHLPGFEELPVADFSLYDKGEPLVEFSQTEIHISDLGGEIVGWVQSEWVEDPAVVFAIANALKFAYENGTEALRRLVGVNGNGHESEDHSGEPGPG
jgi:ParB-like chromosome segregation protein Spo0J